MPFRHTISILCPSSEPPPAALIVAGVPELPVTGNSAPATGGARPAATAGVLAGRIGSGTSNRSAFTACLTYRTWVERKKEINQINPWSTGRGWHADKEKRLLSGCNITRDCSTGFPFTIADIGAKWFWAIGLQWLCVDILNGISHEN